MRRGRFGGFDEESQAQERCQAARRADRRRGTAPEGLDRVEKQPALRPRVRPPWPRMPRAAGTAGHWRAEYLRRTIRIGRTICHPKVIRAAKTAHPRRRLHGKKTSMTVRPRRIISGTAVCLPRTIRVWKVSQPCQKTQKIRMAAKREMTAFLRKTNFRRKICGGWRICLRKMP